MCTGAFLPSFLPSRVNWIIGRLSSKVPLLLVQSYKMLWSNNLFLYGNFHPNSLKRLSIGSPLLSVSSRRQQGHAPSPYYHMQTFNSNNGKGSWIPMISQRGETKEAQNLRKWYQWRYRRVKFYTYV